MQRKPKVLLPKSVNDHDECIENIIYVHVDDEMGCLPEKNMKSSKSF